MNIKKTGKTALFLSLWMFSHFIFAQTPEQETNNNTKPNNTEKQAAEQDTQIESTESAPSDKANTKTAPDTQALRIAQLKAQYPKEDLINLEAQGKSFSALWKKDQSGEALGAILILPSEGQTANWPNTIDVLRKELPQDGWSTLSIDIEGQRQKSTLNTKTAAEKNVEASATTDSNTSNMARMEAAIGFLHQQGQYNIVLVGYGGSTHLVLDYASRADALGMNRSIKSSQSTGLKRPVRALILISPFSYDGERLSKKLSHFPYKDMPILDIIFGSHYLDTFDSKERLSTARSLRFKHYLQSKSVEPSSGERLFGQQNRLSRRIRGFLDSYAKGVEIERR